MSSAVTLRRLTRSAGWLVVALACGSVAVAHGFGQRFDLPVPLSLYLYGAGAAVLLSFVVVAYFLRSSSGHQRYPRFDLLRWRPFRWLASPVVVTSIRALSVVVLVLVVIAGLFGTRDSTSNLAPIVVWVIWWVGVAYVSALVGDVWALLNPWKILFEWAEAAARRFDPEAEISLELPYPERLGVWPAVLLFLAFAWLEIAASGSAVPAKIATAILLYSAVTWAGMVVFGKTTWLRHGEAFTLVFGLLARFAPTEVRVTNAAICREHCEHCSDRTEGCVNCDTCWERAPRDERELAIRPFAVGLLRNEPVSTSMMVFVVLLLSSVTFDGFTATPVWVDIIVGAYATVPSISVITTLGLIAFPLMFLALYLFTCALMGAAAGARMHVLEIGRRFVLTLVPIALAYHLAHYLTYLLVQGQLLVPVLSDPFGFGWNLFGTADYSVAIDVVGPRFTWYTAVIAIVVGHVIAVYLAHVVAQRSFGSNLAALKSQLPMLVLMVGYTVVSLWILAQPVVEAAPPP
jgi:hypothetical protein